MVSKVTVIAEGDSWFSIPHIPPHASSALHYFNLKASTGSLQYMLAGRNSHCGQQRVGSPTSFARYGHTSTRMVRDIREIRKKILECQKANKPIKALLFSAGGNDLIGLFQKGKILKTYPGKSKYREPKQVIHQGDLKDLIKTIKKNYQIFIDLCKKHEMKMIAHSYCYPAPDQGGFRLIDISPEFPILAGPWFEPEFEKKSYPRGSIRNNICKILIDDYFVPMLVQLEKNNKGTFYFIRSHTILKKYHTQASIKNIHLDEIHLKAKGYQILAQEFRKELDARLPDLEDKVRGHNPARLNNP